jgi:CheY-like chemotaxis protein
MGKPEILLVEDNLGDALLLIEALAEGGWDHHLVHLQDGAEALDYLLRRGAHARAVRPDLVLLDLNLPRMDGLEVLEELERQIPLPGLAIFLLSGSEWDPLLPTARHCPRECYLTKPSTFQEYLDLAQRLRARYSPGMLPDRNP